MQNKIERMDINEFREFGYLQEANRLFFHPLGLALEILISDKDGKESLGGIWDYRQDPEGIVFHPDSISKEKISNVSKEFASRAEARMKLLNKNTYIQDPGDVLDE